MPLFVCTVNQFVLSDGQNILMRSSLFDRFFYSIVQSISSFPIECRNSLHFEKCLHPKKPFQEDKGLGCAASKIRWCLPVIRLFFALAYPPQSIKTIGSSLSLRSEMARSVKISQPLFRWLPALPARTVRTLLRSITPFFAHFVSSPWLGGVIPRSDCNSLKIFCKWTDFFF